MTPDEQLAREMWEEPLIPEPKPSKRGMKPVQEVKP